MAKLVPLLIFTDEARSYCKGCDISGTRYKRFTNQNTLGQLTNQNTFCVSEGGASSMQELTTFLRRTGKRVAAIM